jgi:hypothetical protein
MNDFNNTTLRTKQLKVKVQSIPITPTKTTIILQHRRCTLLANKVLIATIIVCGIANTENNKSKPTPFQPWCPVLLMVGKFIPLIIYSLTKLTAFIYIV